MSLFDWYIPEPGLKCHKCGKILAGWQGYDGPCALFVWAQYKASPVDQRVDEETRCSAKVRASKRLPDDFLIHTYCCSAKFSFAAVCETESGIWKTTRHLGANDVDRYFKEKKKEERKAYKAWLA